MHALWLKNMKLGIINILTVLAGMMNAIVISAQSLVPMSADPSIKHAVLPNGLSCYVAANKTVKGFADFFLIKRDYTGNEVVCALEDVQVGEDAAVDSTLLHLMRRIQTDKIPSDQAVIVSGDVDQTSVMTRLRYMSLMVDSSVASPKPEYTWSGSSKIRSSIDRDTLKGLSSIRFEWDSPRTPEEYMNTVQTVMYDKAMWEFGRVLCSSIGRTLKDMDVPLARISCRHDGYDNGYLDEKFTLELVVAEPDTSEAKRVAEGVLSALDAGEVDLHDMLCAENEYMMLLEGEAGRAVKDNGDYVKICRDAFLYDRPMAGKKEILAFLSLKDMSESSKRDVFANITSALLDVDSSYTRLAPVSDNILMSDTLAFQEPVFKEKVRISRKDHFSGASAWTFSNGVKVIYKKMPTGRKLYYSLSLNGGLANIENLERGEGAYISDYHDLCWISGMKGSSFKRLLDLAGMTLNTKVDISSTVISGQVKDRNAGLMMKALLAVANECRQDSTAVEYYTRCDDLNLKYAGEEDMKAVLDSMMCPGYRYSTFKTGAGVGKETFAKAESLFADLTSKVNNGVLVIVGDMPEAELKKTLQTYVGGFRVRNVASRRPAIQYHPVSGWSAYVVSGNSNAALVASSCVLPMTSENHFAAEVAAMMLEAKIKEELKDSKLSVNLSYSRTIYPDERFSVSVDLVGDASHQDVKAFRKVLADCSEDPDPKMMAACKEYVKNAYALKMQTPEYWLRVIPLRHLDGKDFTTGFQAKIDAVSTDQVKSIFKLLEKGAGMEYIVRKTR